MNALSFVSEHESMLPGGRMVLRTFTEGGGLYTVPDIQPGLPASKGV